MRKLLLATAIVFASTQAHAAHRHHHHGYRHHHGRHFAHHRGHHRHFVRYADGRPAAWCGWYMRRELGVSDPRYNLARNWAHWGSGAGGPRVGAVVVWPHHVGRIVGGPDGAGRWLINSGNDGHQVRTRYRSVAGAIAFRVPG